MWWEDVTDLPAESVGKIWLWGKFPQSHRPVWWSKYHFLIWVTSLYLQFDSKSPAARWHHRYKKSSVLSGISHTFHHCYSISSIIIKFIIAFNAAECLCAISTDHINLFTQCIFIELLLCSRLCGQRTKKRVLTLEVHQVRHVHKYILKKSRRSLRCIFRNVDRELEIGVSFKCHQKLIALRRKWELILGRD